MRKKIIGLMWMGAAAISLLMIINYYIGHPPLIEGAFAIAGLCGVTYLTGFSPKSPASTKNRV